MRQMQMRGGGGGQKGCLFQIQPLVMVDLLIRSLDLDEGWKIYKGKCSFSFVSAFKYSRRL